MANTYSKIYIQIVFAVKHRQNLLHKSWRQEVFKYMSGIVTHKRHKSIIVNGVSDHVHLFVGLIRFAILNEGLDRHVNLVEFKAKNKVIA